MKRPRPKDRQPPLSAPALRIPVISPVLHCITMPCLVYLRWGFGYSFLRPRTFFFASSWAMGLFCFYAWHEKEVWRQYWALCLFGAGAIGLYWSHLLIAYARELGRKGEHDYSSGTSPILEIIHRKKDDLPSLVDRIWPMWIEPLMLLAAAAALRLFLGERPLASWLMVSAPCLCFKEYLNFWLQLRQRKRHSDSQEDAFEIMEAEFEESAQPHLAPARNLKVKRQRNQAPSAEDELRLARYSKLLRLEPPLQLEQAERNFRAEAQELEQRGLPSAEHASQLAKLNEAIEFLRQFLRVQEPGDSPQLSGESS